MIMNDYIGIRGIASNSVTGFASEFRVIRQSKSNE